MSDVIERVDRSVWVKGHSECNAPAMGRGPLVGLRLAVKDLFDIEGEITGAGNPDWAARQSPARRTAPGVQALLSAGAPLVGKTQTDEFAYSLNGANVHYGTPINPKAPDRLPGGSSSGSAIAVARGEAEIGLGTDTGGSIRIPSSYNGLWGLRPSHGAISCDGLLPLAPSFDTVGWMCRDHDTLADVADVLLPAARGSAPDRVMTLLVPEALSQEASRFHHTLGARQDLLVQSLSSQWLAHLGHTFRVLQGRDIWRVHGEWLTREQPSLAGDIKARFQWCAQLSELDEQAALRARKEVIEALRTISDDGAQLLAMPTAPGAAPLLSLTGRPLETYRENLMGMTALAGLWGAPQLSMPLLSDHRKGGGHAPWGLSLLGAPGQDHYLIARAGVYGA
ncbi:aspartyl-tRNA(Asn)/glutamyl-tRNA(Gln) amidotransferase subunit A [Kushneria avicenniae]|uniref:Aspartyl-tRNA(Asn)/glutamyl-tRNA(Gln) amidotransferase subunit A n=1 Tax=Kushneria avicenniae TaxID=402385 RepID=A0A1I1J9Z7_9GAMM|nr:amidase [Kushneria avicenniae]SFC43428.1 aspartyl-tRNA(Asn)/glutamyl-tRNA(Gln) amidotransferase subunit A [Kushneria avicenniae]